MSYPKIKIKKDSLLMAVMFTEPNKGVIVDNIKGNIKGFEHNWNENEFIAIEDVLQNFEITQAIREHIIED